MDTKKLRQKILDLAIHGKLVPQDPNDEPASILLGRIRAEKEALIKEGIIKRTKKTTASDTPHYEKKVPEGWTITTLGEAFTLQAGKFISASEIHEQSAPCPFPCFGGNGVRGYVDSFNRNGHYPIIGRQGALCGNINEARGKFYATEHAVVVETYAGVDIDWVISLLEAMNLNQYATATAQPGLSVATINEVQFCLPPLEEQVRITAELKKWFGAICTLDSEANSLCDSISRMKAKVLDLAITGRLVPQDPSDEPAIELLKRVNPAFKPCDNPHYEQAPFAVPDLWTWVKLEDINVFKSKSVNPFDNPSETYELYSVPAFETGEPEFPHGKDIASSKVAVSEGDVLLCKINPHLNRVWVVRQRKPHLKALASSEWIVIRVNEIFPEYLVLAMQTPYFRELMQSNVSGVGGSLMRAQPTFVKQYMIPVPPIQEQMRIVKRIQETFYMLDSISESLC